MEWISVKDRLPDNKEQLNLICGKDFILTAYYQKRFNKFSWVFEPRLCCDDHPCIEASDITHWMSVAELIKDLNK
jgi:hypothetical protein